MIGLNFNNNLREKIRSLLLTIEIPRTSSIKINCIPDWQDKIETIILKSYYGSLHSNVIRI